MDDVTAVFNQFPELETPRLRLRRLELTDAPAMFAFLSDDRVARYFGLDTFTDMQQAYQRIRLINLNFRQRRALRWGIARRDDDLLIGTCGYVSWHQGFHHAAVGYELNRTFWRQGLMTEALTAVLEFGFLHMQLHRIEALVMPVNIRSTRLLQKMGFQCEGLLQDYGYWRGEFHDLYMYALLKQGWLTRSQLASKDVSGLGGYHEI